MLRNYIKLALRQIQLNKAYSAINIIGLSVGLAACFCILIFVNYQLSYDKHNEKLDDIYLLTHRSAVGYFKGETLPTRIAPELKSQIPDIKDIARWTPLMGNFTIDKENITVKKNISADPEIFNILTLPFSSGDMNSLKKVENYIVISETIAKNYFKNNPIGQIITYNLYGAVYNLNVIGVMKDIPATSTFSADVIVPFYITEKMYDASLANYNESRKFLSRNTYTYILLNEHCTAKEFNNKLEEFNQKNKIYSEKNIFLESFALKDVYFHLGDYLQDSKVYSLFPSGDMTNIYIYSGAAFIILLMALINYMLLGIGRASLRTKEVCVRKVTGAGRGDLFKQTATEAITLTFISLPFAIALLEYLLPYLSMLFGREIPSVYFHNWTFVIFSFGVTLLVGFLTGAYISLYLSRFNPLEIMKNKFAIGSGKVVLRRVMISAQLVISIGLLFIIITVNKQIDYCKTGIKGLDKDNLVVLTPSSFAIGQNYEAFKTELKKNSSIMDVSFAWYMPGSKRLFGFLTERLDDPQKMITADFLMADADIIETLKLKIKEGSSFRQFNATADSKLCLINESAVKELGADNPIGRTIYDAKIIGIVEDFHSGSFKSKMKPTIIKLEKSNFMEISVRIDPKNTTAAINHIQEVSKQFKNKGPMKYQFYDDYLGGLYSNEITNSDIMKYATIIIFVIACMGLFGVSLFVTQQRVKEIGIRKVVGASVRNIYALLTKEFIAIAIFASFIAFPIAYYLINSWLNNFAYKTTIDIWIFILSGAIGIGVVMLTISFQAIKVSLINPVDSLRSE